MGTDRENGKVDELIEIKRFHETYPGMEDLYHVYCAEHPDYGFCGEIELANAQAASHRARHHAEVL